MRALLASSSLLLVVACAGSRSSTRFTSADELKRLVAQPRPSVVFDKRTKELDRWELVLPLPDRYEDAPHEATTPAGRALTERAKTKGFRTSAAMECVARQTARLIAVTAAAPRQALERYLEARCGVATAGTSTRWISGTAPTSVSDEALLGQWKQSVDELLAKVAPDAEAGLVLSREGETAVLALASARRETTLEPVSMLPSPDGTVLVRGSTTRPVDRFEGAANQGRTGSAPCVNTGTRQPPAFELKCPVSKEDAAAWISIAGYQKGRVLGHEVVRLLVRPNGSGAATWERPGLVERAPGSTAQDFAAQLNAVRASIGAPALTLSEGQTLQQLELAPYYFEAVMKSDEAVEDRIALGVLAGWRVEQEIMNGTFGASVVESPTSAELLSSMLESPGYRKALLSPRAGVLAVGLFQEGEVLGGVVSTYEPIQAPVWPTTSDEVLTKLNAQRAKNGKPPVQWVLLPSSSEPTIAEGVAKREFDSEEALQKFMGQATSVTQRPVRGWRIPVLDLEDFTWPAEVLSKESIEVLFVVTTERNPKDAWGQYVLLLVILEGAGAPST